MSRRLLPPGAWEVGLGGRTRRLETPLTVTSIADRTLRAGRTGPPGLLARTDPLLHGRPADADCVNRDVAPVVAAQALLANGTDDHATLAYLKRTWWLDDIDAEAALATAHVLVRRERRKEHRGTERDVTLTPE